MEADFFLKDDQTDVTRSAPSASQDCPEIWFLPEFKSPDAQKFLQI